VKKSASYRTRIPVEDLLNYPNAYLFRDVLSQTGSTVLIPSRVPISKLIEGLDNPKRIIDSLDRMNVRKIEIEIPQDLDDEDVLLRLAELDPSVTIIDNEVTNKGQSVMADIFTNMTIDEKYNIPKDDIESLGRTLTKEVNKVSQIALSLISSEQDTYTQSHALNVSLLAAYIAKKLVEDKKAPESAIEKSTLAGLLFDLGKAKIPKEILDKNSELDEKETTVMRGHIGASISMCKEAGITDKELLDGIATHHERYDGSGYPSGMVGTHIPIIGRILAVADTFDAMTSPRIYKSAVSSKLSFNFIMSANETSFDPDICKIFIAGMGVYPPGSVVELSNGKIATVVAMTSGNLLQPKVAIKEEGKQKVLDLAAEQLFVRRSMDVDPRDDVNFLEDPNWSLS
jgi:HD-GYP domain-containing protein (c-di-GMP phosphodiesterase class II)